MNNWERMDHLITVAMWASTIGIFVIGLIVLSAR